MTRRAAPPAHAALQSTRHLCCDAAGAETHDENSGCESCSLLRRPVSERRYCAPSNRPSTRSPRGSTLTSTKPRIIVLTDIANEPDDQMSMVRFLVYSNQFDVEGLVATTSTWMRNRVRPDVIHSVIDAYAQVRPNLLKHHARISRGRRAAGAGGVGTARRTAWPRWGPDTRSAGSDLILQAAGRSDPRPLWIACWGGTNTLAQALLTRARHAVAGRARRAHLEAARLFDLRPGRCGAVDPPRVSAPALHRVAVHAGRRRVLLRDVDRHQRRSLLPQRRRRRLHDVHRCVGERATSARKGPLGKLYPHPCCIHEGDTPSFLGLIDNGLASAMSPTFGGWGGRYVWRQPSGEPRAIWTEGGDSFPGNDNSRDTVIGVDGQAYTSDQATIWRWRTAFQHDFAARMDWTIADPAHANHNPEVVVNGQRKAPLMVDAVVGTPLTFDASGTATRTATRSHTSGFSIPKREPASPVTGRASASGVC